MYELRQNQIWKWKGNWRLFCNSIAVVLLVVFFACPVSAQSRRLKVGKSIPEFSGRTLKKSAFKFEHGNKKVLLVAFLSADQKNSKGAAEDLLRITNSLKCKPQDIDFVVVTDKASVKDYFDSGRGDQAIVPKVILDDDYKVWGAFGIIACPTVIIGGLEGKVLCVKAGHSYDFAPVVKARLNQALGIAQDVDPEKAGEVKILKNKTPQARAARNLQLAKAISAKGKYGSALTYAKKALEIDPDSIAAKFEAGRLYCLLDEGDAALSVIAGIESQDALWKAELALIKGWANRRLEKYEIAEKFLLEAFSINGKSPRILLELGNLYLVTGRPEKAAQAYHSALNFLLGKER